MDASFLPFTPNFSTTHSVIIERQLIYVVEKLGKPEAHEEVVRLSDLCTGYQNLDKDVVELDQGKTIKDSSVLQKAAVKGEAGATSTSSIANRQHFLLEETVPVLFGLIKSKVNLRGVFTWVDTPEESYFSGGPIYALYESEVIGGLAIRIWRLRKMEEVDSEVHHGEKATKVTETLHGVGPSYLKWFIAKEAETKHG
jgi:ubiquinone biosynthesis protein COQ9